MAQLVPMDAKLLMVKAAPVKGRVDRLVVMGESGLDSLEEDSLEILEIHLPKPQPWNPKLKEAPEFDRIDPTVKVVLTDNAAGAAIFLDEFLELGEAEGGEWGVKYFSGRVMDITEVNGKLVLTVSGLFIRGVVDGTS